MPKPAGPPDPPVFCSCGKSPGRKEFGGLCTPCFNGKTGPDMELKYNRKPTIEEITAKHEVIIKDMIKAHEQETEIFNLEREKFRHEKRLYEMQIDDLQKKYTEIFTAHSQVKADFAAKIAEFQEQMNHRKPGISPEEQQQIEQQIAEKEAEIARLEAAPTQSEAAPAKKGSSLYAPTAASQARVSKKKVISK